MVFNFLTKCLLQMKGRGSIPFQWEVLVEELRMGERGVRQAHSQWYFPKAQSVFILWKRGTWVRRMRLGWGRVSCSILEEPRDLQCCQSSVLHKVLLTWAQKTSGLIQSPAILSSPEAGIVSCQIHLTFVQKVLHWSSSWMLWISTIIKIYRSFSWNVNTQMQIFCTVVFCVMELKAKKGEVPELWLQNNFLVSSIKVGIVIFVIGWVLGFDSCGCRMLRETHWVSQLAVAVVAVYHSWSKTFIILLSFCPLRLLPFLPLDDWSDKSKWHSPALGYYCSASGARMRQCGQILFIKIATATLAKWVIMLFVYFV